MLDLAVLGGSAAAAGGLLILRELLVLLFQRRRGPRGSNHHTHDEHEEFHGKLEEVKQTLVLLTTKVDTLWEVVVLDGLKSARREGHVAMQSPEAPTEAFRKIFPRELYAHLIDDATKLTGGSQSIDEVTLILWTEHREQLLEVVDNTELRPSVLMAILRTLVDRVEIRTIVVA